MKILSFFTKILHFLPTEISHKLALEALKAAHLTGLLGLLVPISSKDKIVSKTNEDNNFLDTLDNKLGLAAGLDKDGEYIDCLASLGIGFIELGTVTPKPQKGNPKPRLFRQRESLALVNRMGFNNKGVDRLVEMVKKSKSGIPIGISIGKNYDTPNEKAYEDYLICLEKVYKYADYVAINISSPNTKNLRDLSSKENLEFLLEVIKNKQVEMSLHFGYKPIYLKISPDESDEGVFMICKSAIDKSIDGIICSNTSIKHDNLNGYGGLSGKPLSELSTALLKKIRGYVGKDFLLIASGGVMTKEDYFNKLDAGADLVQIYTGFIFEGPKLISDIVNS